MSDSIKILSEVLKNDRVAKKVDELKLTKEQMIDALPILIDMANEKDDENTHTLTSFYIDAYGFARKTFISSKEGKKLLFLNNIVTQDINYVDFKEEEFIKEPGRKEAVEKFAKIIKGENPNKGLYLYGEMGIGKTFILKKFAKMLAAEGHQVGFINLSNLISSIRSTFNDDTASSEILIDRLKNVEYLFIDDIGSEKISSWFRDDFLFMLLNERMDRKRSTFFSSNYSQDQLILQESKTANSKYRDTDKAKRLISRVKALSIEVKINGNNKRY